MRRASSWRSWPAPRRRHGFSGGWFRHWRRTDMSRDKKRVLILCTGNSARSQMSEGLLRQDAGDRFEVESAGTKPGAVRPEAIAVMREAGIDIAGQRSKHVDEFKGRKFDYVITVCDHARESCPAYFGDATRFHHDFEDPAAVQG